MLEILLVIAVVGIIAGAIGINVTKAVREQRFDAEVDLVADQLRLAQDLMVIFHANISVVLTVNEKKNGYILELIPDVSLPTPWLNEIQRKNKMSYIHIINYSGLTKEQGQLKLNFRSGGSEMPHGTLRFSTNEIDDSGALTSYIHFPGYPAPISVVKSKTSPFKGDEEINIEATQRTVEVIRAIPTIPK